MTALLLDKVKTWMRRQGGTSRAARPRLHGRDLRLLPAAPGEPADEAAAADAAEAGARAGRRRRARHAEPGGPRLQGPRQHGHLDGRDAADAAGPRPAAGAASRARASRPRRSTQLLARDEEARRSCSTTCTARRPCLLQSRWAMSYLRGPLTRDEIARLDEGDGRGRGRRARRSAAAAPRRARRVAPRPVPHLYLTKYGGRGGRGAPARQVRRALQGRRRDGGRARVAARRARPPPRRSRPSRSWSTSSAIAAEAPAGLRYRRPARVARRGRGRRGSRGRCGTGCRQARRHGLPRPGDERGLGRRARRARPSPRALQARAAATPRRQLRQKLDKKQADLAIARAGALRAQAGEVDRHRHGGAAATSASSPAASARSRRRLRPHARTAWRTRPRPGSRRCAAEVADLERQPAEMTAVDPARLVEEALAPVRGGVELLRYDLVWVVLSPMPDQYLLHLPDGTQYGPVDRATLEAWHREGRLPEETLVWPEGAPEWLSVGAVLATAPSPAAHAGARGRARAATPAAAPHATPAPTATPTPPGRPPRRGPQGQPRPRLRVRTTSGHAAAMARPSRRRPESRVPRAAVPPAAPLDAGLLVGGVRRGRGPRRGLWAVLRPCARDAPRPWPPCSATPCADRRVEDARRRASSLDLPPGLDGAAPETTRSCVDPERAPARRRSPRPPGLRRDPLAVRPRLMDELDAHLDSLLQERLAPQPSQKETRRARRAARPRPRAGSCARAGRTACVADAGRDSSPGPTATTSSRSRPGRPPSAGDVLRAEVEALCRGIAADRPPRRAHRRGRGPAGARGAGTFPRRAASSGSRAHEPGRGPRRRAAGGAAHGEPRPRRPRARGGRRDAGDLPAGLGAGAGGGARAARRR